MLFESFLFFLFFQEIKSPQLHDPIFVIAPFRMHRVGGRRGKGVWFLFYVQHSRLGTADTFISMLYVFTLIVRVLYTPFLSLSITSYLPAHILFAWILASEVLWLLFWSYITTLFTFLLIDIP